MRDAMERGTHTLLLNRLPVDGPQPSANAKRSLLKGKVTVAILKGDANLCLKNDLLGLWDPTQPFFRENSLSLLHSVLERKEGGLQALKKRRCCSTAAGQGILEGGGSTAAFMSFLEWPDTWVDPSVDVGFEEGVDPFAVEVPTGGDNTEDELDRFMQTSMASAFLDYRKCNTRMVEQDTNYHRLERPAAAVVIGDINAVANAMAPLRLTYAQACDRTVKSVFGAPLTEPLDTSQKHFRRSNDFPVLVGLDTTTFVRRDGRVYPVDFYGKTKANGEPLVPLLLTSATEVILRVQMQYLTALYRIGCVRLDPRPVETNCR